MFRYYDKQALVKYYDKVDLNTNEAEERIVDNIYKWFVRISIVVILMVIL